MMNTDFSRLRRGACGLAAAVGLLLAAGLESARANPTELIDEEAAPVRESSIPLVAVVSLRDQRISIYGPEGRLMRSPVSSGQTTYETPVGIYSLLQKKAEHYSNIYDDASMPFMQRLTWSGVALHAGELPGYPASHGCVRLPINFAEQLFGVTKLGMRVVISSNDVAPVTVSHPSLPKPKPATAAEVAVATPTAYRPAGDSEADPEFAVEPDVRRWPGRQAQVESLKTIAAAKAADAEALKAPAEELRRAARTANAARAKAIKASRGADYAKRRADERLADAEKWLEKVKEKAKEKEIPKAEEAKAKAATKAAEAQTKLDEAKAAEQAAVESATRASEALKAADAAKDAAAAAAAEAGRAIMPVAGFVSLKTQKLYIRQGREQVLEVPVTIRDPEQPIGTHIFTALAYSDDGNDVQWNVVSVESANSDNSDSSYTTKKHKKARSAEPVATDVAAATAALDRITMPQEAVDRLSQYVWPGSSLIISDEPASKETGKATEFVVLLSGYPQGGVKKRRPPPVDPYFEYYSDYYDRGYRRPRGSPKFGFWW